jgi:LuxR family maltose regulon positive regulatory protein
MAPARDAQAIVLDTKLRPPRTLGPVVRRERLLAPLIADDDPGRTVTAVSAPAGAGKTVLLGQWWRQLRESNKPVAWLSVDTDDNDPLAFWSATLAACRRALHKTPAAAGIEAISPPVAVDAEFLETFYRAIAQHGETFWLILDDVHEINTSQVLDGLGRLLRTAPPTLKLMLGCRFDPPLPLPRMVLEGTAGEIRAADLAFDAPEARELLSGHGIDLVNGDLELLLARTEGWAAGLRLAALSLAQQKDVTAYLETFAGDDKSVADYLVSEVLSKLPDETRSFLLVTAVPDRLTADLARELSGRPDAGSVLDRLAHDNVFVYRHGSKRRLYHYHALLQSYLRAELQRQDSSAPARLNTRAAEWFAARDTPSQALVHAVAAESWPLVTNLVDRHGLRLILTGETRVLSRVLGNAPGDVLADARVSLIAAVAALHAGDLAVARAHLDRVGNDPSHHDDSRTRLMHATALLHEAQLRGEVSPQVLRLAEQTRAHVVDDPDLELLATATRGMALVSQGQTVAADAELTLALRLAREQHRDMLALECLSHSTTSAAALGDLDGTLTRTEHTIEFATERGWALAPPMVRTYLMAASAAWREMRIKEADRLVGLAGGIEVDVEPQTSLAVRVLLAYTEFERTGDRARLVAAITKAWADVDRRAIAPTAVSHYCLQDVRAALAAGDRGWARETADRAGDLLGADAADVAVLDAVVDVHHSRTVAARTKLAPVLGDTATCIAVTTAIAAWLLEAQLADANDEPVRAHEALVNAVRLAAPAREIRTLVTASDHVRRLLIRGRGRFGQHDEFVGEVFAAARDTDGAPGRLRGGETLTARELELLRDLPSMLSLVEIAKAHVVSVNTVKTHLKSLYRKLDVASRREAVTHGRDLGLL